MGAATPILFNPPAMCARLKSVRIGKATNGVAANFMTGDCPDRAADDGSPKPGAAPGDGAADDCPQRAAGHRAIGPGRPFCSHAWVIGSIGRVGLGDGENWNRQVGRDGQGGDREEGKGSHDGFRIGRSFAQMIAG